MSIYLRDIIWRSKHLSVERKVRFYKICIRTIMATHGICHHDNNRKTNYGTSFQNTEIYKRRHEKHMQHHRSCEVAKRKAYHVDNITDDRWTQIKKANLTPRNIVGTNAGHRLSIFGSYKTFDYFYQYRELSFNSNSQEEESFNTSRKLHT